MQPSPPKITLRIPDAHKGHIHSLAYNSTGRYVLSGGQDRSISLWNSTTGTLIKHYRAVGTSKTFVQTSIHIYGRANNSMDTKYSTSPLPTMTQSSPVVAETGPSFCGTYLLQLL
jgi:WD40 repeat protein